MTQPLSASTARCTRLLVAAMFTLWFLTGAFGLAYGSDELREGRDFASRDCYAHLTETQLVVGNSHVRRTWRLEHGRLFATSFLDLDEKVEWINVPSTLPSPTPPVQTDAGRFVMRGGSGIFGPTEAESLRIELETAATNPAVDYEFQVFPQAMGIRMWIVVKGNRAEPASTVATPLPPGTQPATDSLEHLQITCPHQHRPFRQTQDAS